MVTLLWLGVSVVALYVVYRVGYNLGYDDGVAGTSHYFRDERTAPTDPPMIMEAQHWQLRGADFNRFFEALSEIAPVEALLVLAEGSPPSELREFYAQHAKRPEGAVVKALRAEFRDGVFLPTTPPLMSAFAALAAHHAPPEVAIHLAVVGAQGALLEWFDATDDPASIAAFVEEEPVRRFAERTGATYTRRPGIS